ncbi:MAG TPA: GNAT family N-acetyltransferase [Candidatus Limnocylindrales bacterium]|nr:GNAT family N-acetyltransferase [Candidatus Limnocylindrales bacterium]
MTTTQAAPRIRPMTAADTEAAAELLRRGDWGERWVFFDWAISRPTVAPIVAERDGEVVGTGVGSAHGRVGWVGTIFVAADHRGSGLGRALTRAVIDDLEARGCRTLVLIATSMGRPLYEHEEFDVLDEQVRFSIDGLPADAGPPDPLVRSFTPDDLDAVVALDRFATGEDRAAVLSSLLTPSSTSVAVDAGGAVRGYLARAPWRGGGLIAPDPDDALRLLEMRRRSTGVSGRAGAGLVGCNRIGRERLLAAGWREESSGVRMIRGEPLDWHPEAIWGQFNGALG